MDEFEKIKNLSDNIINRKEPTFSGDDIEADDSEMYHFNQTNFNETMEALTERKKFFKWHLIALIFFLSVLAIVLTLLFMLKNNEGNEQVITITATPHPVKVKPEQPGGMKIPNQDKLIYSVINSENIPTKVENLFPEPEKPVLPDILEQFSDEKENVEIKIESEKELAPKKEVLILPEKSPKKESIVPEKQQWRVQLISTTKQSTAEKLWKELSQKHKALLSDMSHSVTSVEISGKGTFYRLQVGYFQTREMAGALCEKLKAKKQECVPVKASK